MRFGAVEIETHDGQHFFQVEVFPGNINPDQLTSRTLRRLSSGRPTCPRGDDCTQTQRRFAGRADLFGPRIRNSSRERLHCAHHSPSSQRICAARSTADPLAALIDKADREIRVIYPCSRTSAAAASFSVFATHAPHVESVFLNHVDMQKRPDQVDKISRFFPGRILVHNCGFRPPSSPSRLMRRRASRPWMRCKPADRPRTWRRRRLLLRETGRPPHRYQY